MADLRIREVTSLSSRQIEQLILTSDPWKTLGYQKKDAVAMAKVARTRRGGRGFDKLVLGAFRGRELVGFAYLRGGFLGGWYLNNLVVSEAERGQGIGRALMQAAENIVFTESKNLYLCVSSFNKRGQLFYRALGYKKIGVLQALVVRRHDEILMRKTTGPFRP